ncbi:MAG: NUDIX domain-containing protein [bacterium]
MIFNGATNDFKADCHCVGCYIVNNGRILLLKKLDSHELYPGKWGVVAGKKRVGESIFKAMEREVLEETCLSIKNSPYRHISTYRVVHPGLKFFYHVFLLELLGKEPPVLISPEHQAHMWSLPCQATSYDLIEDEANLINYHFNR